MENKKMPVLFVGHGSPMNAMEDNEFTTGWEAIGKRLPKPKAILAISAHWYTSGTQIQDEEHPKMIYDMYGFPPELYDIVYPANGSPFYAHKTRAMISRKVQIQNDWGYDHGTWSVLTRLFPKADIPVYQLSVDATASASEHFKIGQEIQALRDEGVLIFGSGDVVHNLRMLDWECPQGFSWAQEFDEYIKNAIVGKKFEDVVQYKDLGRLADLAVPTPDHYFPLLYVLGAVSEEDRVEIFNEQCVMGSLSMTSYLFY